MDARYLLIALLLPCFAMAEYRVPSVDSPESSPPTVSGTVIDINGNILQVESAGNELSVLTNRATHIFTSYGGIVYLNEICQPSAIEIWYRDPGSNPKIAYAASIRLFRTC